MHAGDARRQDLPLRGDHPLRPRRPGRAGLDLLRQDDRRARAARRPTWSSRSPGFNIIATANARDQGVNELSAALKRRFNYIHIPVVADQKTEVEIVRTRSAELLERYKIPGRIEEPVLELLATVFREMRQGTTGEGVSLQKPSTTLSTAEAIGVALDSAIHSRYFGSGNVGPADIARNLVGSIVKEDLADLQVLKEYMNLVAKKRAASDPAWKTFYEAAVKVLSA